MHRILKKEYKQNREQKFAKYLKMKKKVKTNWVFENHFC
jgi:hypothetical protein